MAQNWTKHRKNSHLHGHFNMQGSHSNVRIKKSGLFGDFSVGVMVINKDCFSIILYFVPRKNYVESKARCHNAHVTQLFIYHP